MNQPSVTISLNFTVPAHDATALLQKLLAALPAGADTTMTAPAAPPGQDIVARSWPPIPATAGEAYQKVAEENLRQLREGAIPDNGWGVVKDLPRVINSLPSETRKVVRRAIENGGHITRDEVYEVIGRDESKSLKGFTKPASSLTDRLISNGALPENAKPLLAPIYRKSKTFQQAQGFTVPVQVVSLMTQHMAQPA